MVPSVQRRTDPPHRNAEAQTGGVGGREDSGCVSLRLLKANGVHPSARITSNFYLVMHGSSEVMVISCIMTGVETDFV